jgi:hypothetical protein
MIDIGGVGQLSRTVKDFELEEHGAAVCDHIVGAVHTIEN